MENHRFIMSISDDDSKLFREAVGRVRRLRRERAETGRDRPRAEPVQRHRDEAEVISELGRVDLEPDDVEIGDEITWLRPGLQRRILRRLRRGHYTIGDELDLHGMNTEIAGRAVREFIDDARGRGLSCVKIIHGKGLRSGPGGPQLKHVAARILIRHSHVLALSGARRNDGGTGAVYVLLRNRR